MQPTVIPKTMAEAIPAAVPLQRHSLQAQVVWGQRIVTVGGASARSCSVYDQHRHR